MSDLSITAASVVSQAGAIVEHGVAAGETIVAGKVVYKNSTTNKWMLADNNSATAEAKIPKGISLNGGGDGQPISVHKSGPISMGAVFTAGVGVYLSDTAGGICPVADVGSGENAVFLGMPSTTSILQLDIQVPGVTL